MLSSLSPRRRLLVYAVAALVVVGAVTAVAYLPHHETAAIRPTATRPPAAQDRPGIVLLVPGFGGKTASLTVLVQALQRAGRRVTVVDEGDANGPIEDQARVLDSAVRKALKAGAPSVDLVGYSNGGIVVRYWVRHDDGAHRARRVVTLGSPHHGTEIAALAIGNAPNLCPAACRQVTPDSTFLAALNRGDETPDGPVWTSIYSADDGTIIPATSSRLDGATNEDVEQLCPRLRITHSLLPRTPIVVDLVERALGVRTSARNDCRAASR